jgi:hypothetical protein
MLTWVLEVGEMGESVVECVGAVVVVVVGEVWMGRSLGRLSDLLEPDVKGSEKGVCSVEADIASRGEDVACCVCSMMIVLVLRLVVFVLESRFTVPKKAKAS